MLHRSGDANWLRGHIQSGHVLDLCYVRIQALDRVQLKLSLRDAGFGVGRKAGTRRNSKAISRASNTASGFEDKSQQISLS